MGFSPEGSATGTVWDNINPTQPNYTNSKIPRSFELTTESGEKLWVHGNATKHMFDYTKKSYSHGKNMNEQVIISSFESEVNKAIPNLTDGRNIVTIDAWELGINKDTKVIFHAVYR